MGKELGAGWALPVQALAVKGERGSRTGACPRSGRGPGLTERSSLNSPTLHSLRGQ